ncbi:MAG: hypothetical protein U5N55_04385 [Cypionkella sp.]|nr:hypothetical protein [Cypionkella sp.]
MTGGQRPLAAASRRISAVSSIHIQRAGLLRIDGEPDGARSPDRSASSTEAVIALILARGVGHQRIGAC